MIMRNSKGRGEEHFGRTETKRKQKKKKHWGLPKRGAISTSQNFAYVGSSYRGCFIIMAGHSSPSPCHRFLRLCEYFATRRAVPVSLLLRQTSGMAFGSPNLHDWVRRNCASAVDALHTSVFSTRPRINGGGPLACCRFGALGGCSFGSVFHCFAEMVYLFLRGKAEFYLQVAVGRPSLYGVRESFTDGHFACLRAKLRDLGLHHVLIDGFKEIIHGLVIRKVEYKCRGRFDCTQLIPAREWLRESVMQWLDDVIGFHHRAQQPGTLHGVVEGLGAFSDVMKLRLRWRTRLEYLLYETFCTMRIAELFDIITEYPESIPALDDLNTALAFTRQHNVVAPALRFQFGRRLLHPGANTNQVLDVYISTFKALRHLDASGVLLEAVSAPIKLYLRSRKDTVRCIVTSFTEDNRSDLFDEFTRADRSDGVGHDAVRLISHDDDADDEECGPGNFWEPDPIDADPTKTSRSRTSGDILSMLVQIYGSKELFVKEYAFALFLPVCIV